jgi:hypothetical protein
MMPFNRSHVCRGTLSPDYWKGVRMRPTRYLRAIRGSSRRSQLSSSIMKSALMGTLDWKGDRDGKCAGRGPERP